MSIDRPRRPDSARDKAEALFRPAAPKPAAPAPEARRRVPGTREMVTLRIDSEVLEYFQSAGPGWQDSINEALRQAAGIGGGDAALTPGELNSSNDG